MRQFKQQILPTTYPDTTVWGYGSVDAPGTVAEGGSFSYPAFTVEAESYERVRVKWINDLVDADGNFLPHLLPIDQTLHWANPGQDCRPGLYEVGDGPVETDCRGQSAEPYTGPVPMVTHVHGAHVGPESDGYPEAWWLPKANNIPPGFATSGSQFGDITTANSGPHLGMRPNDGTKGYALFEYPNSQPAATLWYHDHAMGMTRNNVYAMSAGFWILRDDVERRLKLPGAERYRKRGHHDGRVYELPLAIQDRSFNPDGSLFYPESRARFDGFTGPYMPEASDGVLISDVPPIWNPEAFFETMVVNGRTWPFHEVEPRRYRLRLLNGSNSRFLNLSLIAYDAAGLPLGQVPFYQIGAEGGLLPHVVEITTGFKTVLPGDGTIPGIKTPAPHPDEGLLMGLAERADVIVDFSRLPAGTTHVRMLNTGPDTPFGGFPIDPAEVADPNSTGQVMEFRVSLLRRGKDRSTPVEQLRLPAITPLVPDAPVRYLSLNEAESVLVDEDGNPLPGGTPVSPVAALLGTYDPATMTATPLLFTDPIAVNPELGATEEWELYNRTEDAHPIHLHLVQFQVLERRNIDGSPIDRDGNGVPDCTAPCVEPNETGFKDTVVAYPGEVTKVIALFDIAGLFLWHCHIIEHEDNEMMLPVCVGEAGVDCPAELFDAAPPPLVVSSADL